MSDDLVKQAVSELQDLVRCRCSQSYKERGLHYPDCHCDSADAVTTVVNRVEELDAKLARAMLTIEALQSLRPVWAQGWTDDSMAAQASGNALSELWGMLGVKDQTQAVATLAELKGTNQ